MFGGFGRGGVFAQALPRWAKGEQVTSARGQTAEAGNGDGGERSHAGPTEPPENSGPPMLCYAYVTGPIRA